MSREKILADSEWFHPVSKDALLEDEYESQILANAADIFRGYRAIPFKQSISSPEFGTARPDFLIFDHDLRSWWVIEVEMSRHSLVGHVEPQVAALSHGSFTESHVQKVAEHFDDASDFERVRTLMLSVQANVLVVVNEPCDAWRDTLAQYEASLLTVVPYQSRRGTFIFRQLGEIPGLGTNVLSGIQIRRDVTRALIIDNRAALPFEQKQVIDLYVGGMSTRWRCHFVANTLMLFCLESRFPFDSAAGSFVLVRLGSGEYAVERQTSRVVGKGT